MHEQTETVMKVFCWAARATLGLRALQEVCRCASAETLWSQRRWMLPSVRCDGDYSTAADDKSGITALGSSVQAPLISIYWKKKIGIAKHCN